MAKKTSSEPNSFLNSLSNVLVGVGIGVLITYPIVVEHPVRWGVGFVILGALLHLFFTKR